VVTHDARRAFLALAIWLFCTPSGRAQDRVVYSEVGTASYYGAELVGQRTASGARYDPAQLTAAHPTLPLGAEVTVVALASGRQVDVRITDRGPFTGGRDIDLSQRAAEKLGIVKRGVAKVRITATEQQLEQAE
jgi:rare lipoprotein A